VQSSGKRYVVQVEDRQVGGFSNGDLADVVAI